MSHYESGTGLEKLKIAIWSSHFRLHTGSLLSHFLWHLWSLPSGGHGTFCDHFKKISVLQYPNAEAALLLAHLSSAQDELL